MSNTKKFFAGFALLLVLVGLAFAGPVETVYRQMRGAHPASVAAQTSATGAQSSVWSTAPINPVACNSNPFVMVEANFQTASATCVVTMGRYHYDGSTYQLLGIKSATLTASSTESDAGAGSAKRYIATAPVQFDTYGADYYDLRMAAPSSGSVTITHYPGGGGPRPGE